MKKMLLYSYAQEVLYRMFMLHQTIYSRMNTVALKSAVLAIFFMACTTVKGYDFSVDGIYYTLLQDNVVTVVAENEDIVHNDMPSNYVGNIVIPSTVMNNGTTYRVTSIAGRAFFKCDKLTSITIPSSIASIGITAFEGCTALKTLTLPKGVTHIGALAFMGCTGLESLVMESVESLGDAAFNGCISLKKLYIPSTLKGWGADAFQNCSGLEEIVVDQNNAYLSSRNGCNGIFSDHSLLLGCKNTIIPNDIVNISYSAFRGCRGLTSITIPQSVKEIGTSAFQDCTSLTEINIPSSVDVIGAYAFMGCTSLKDFVIPYGVNVIAGNMFQGCTGLVNVKMHEGITSIAQYAFDGCTNLSSMFIPLSVKNIGQNAFRGCTKCSFLCANETPATAIATSFPSKAKCLVLPSALTKYKAATGWKNLSFYTNLTNFIQTQITQTTIKLIFPKGFFGHTVTCIEKTHITKTDSLVISGLKPNTRYTINFSSLYNSIEWTSSVTLTTKPIYITIKTTTQTNHEVILQATYDAGDAIVKRTGWTRPQEIEGDVMKIENMWAGGSSYYNYFVELEDGTLINSGGSAYTLRPIPIITMSNVTPTSCVLTGSWKNVVDAKVTNYGFRGYEGQKKLTITGLEPNSKYDYWFTVTVENGSTETASVQVQTSKLELTTQQPKVISNGNVIVCGMSNIKIDDEKVGFEWRRTDWTDDFKSNEGTAYLYEGEMEGFIRNLNTEKLWKFRPYYESAAGKRYYGEWVGLDPTNTSYFEPSVHTYANISVSGNTATLSGYAQQGSDNIASRGFKYWPEMSGSRAYATTSTSIPENALIVEAKGTVMETRLTGLSYETTYSYAAFVTTSEGETFYGDVRQFTTEADPTGVEETVSPMNPQTKEYYDIRGRRQQHLQKGLNIIRLDNGMTKKVIVK